MSRCLRSAQLAGGLIRSQSPTLISGLGRHTITVYHRSLGHQTKRANKNTGACKVMSPSLPTAAHIGETRIAQGCSKRPEPDPVPPELLRGRNGPP